MTQSDEPVQEGFVRHHTGEVLEEFSALGPDAMHKAVFEEMIEDVYSCNVANGWFEKGRSFGDEMALLHSEVSKALEEFRRGRMKTVFEYYGGLGTYYSDSPENEEMTLGKPVGMPSELADILIRVFNVAKRYNVDLVREFRINMRYNRSRGHRHGGKTL